MDNQEMTVKNALDAWHSQIKRTSLLFDSLTDEQLQQEIAPGRNTGVYLLGHLVAVHDAMLPLLMLGDQSYSGMEEAFLKNPDKSGIEFPSIADLRNRWAATSNLLEARFNAMPVQEWFERHNSVSPQDFMNEPHRNKLGVLISRTIHAAYHQGQIAFLKPRA